MKTRKEKIQFQIAVHIPSGCRLVGGEWLIDASLEEQFARGQTNYKDFVKIVTEDDENYDANDCEQEHSEDYDIIEEEIELEYTAEQQEDYAQYVSDHQSNLNNYYGFCMNGGGGKKAFQSMYGDGSPLSFGEWLLNN